MATAQAATIQRRFTWRADDEEAEPSAARRSRPAITNTATMPAQCDIATITMMPPTDSTASASRSLTSMTRNRSRRRRPSHSVTVNSASKSTSRNHSKLGSNGHPTKSDKLASGVQELPGTPNGRPATRPTNINTTPRKMRMITPTNRDCTTAHHAFM